jgi:tRNA threonylcarbamoyladenosine biosynthesis protein TsaE
MEIKFEKLSELPEAISQFLQQTKNKKHFALYGPMGVGKTTIIKEICRQLNVIEVVTSPTFAIINEYHTLDNQLVYHFDLYRINKPEELFDVGYEDYLFSDNYCFIEWPEKGEDLLPSHIQKVNLTEMPDGSRIIAFTV